MRWNRFWKFFRIPVRMNPFFTCKSHPLNTKLFKLFSTHNARNRNTDDPILSGSPDNKVSVFSMKPARKFMQLYTFFDRQMKHLSNETSFSAAVTVIVNQFSLVRLLIPCYQFCTCNKKPSDNSFTSTTNLFFNYHRGPPYLG